MTDDQTARLLATLADAFERAATRCTHKTEAASYIRKAMRDAGFVFVATKSKAPSSGWSNTRADHA
jgi:hypothetical protein